MRLDEKHNGRLWKISKVNDQNREEIMTTKQRAYLKSLAMTMDPIFQIGKSSITPGLTQAISEALEARELVKISVLQNCTDDPGELAQMIAERSEERV